MPNLHYIYAFDNVAFPYGEKSEEFIVERVLEIVTAVQQRYPLALAVIACNTASTVSLPPCAINSLPVVGVVPAIKPAARLTANGVVGLLATRGTVKRPYTRELISRFANECKIEMLGSAELVELAEAKLHGEPVPLDELRRILRPGYESRNRLIRLCWGVRISLDTRRAAAGSAGRDENDRLRSGDARRTAWLLEHEAPDAKSSDANIAYCMALTPETEQL
ncbi:glutamate racemase [Escherichia coli]